MKRRDLPEVVKATFGVASHLCVKLLTSVGLLHNRHSVSLPISRATTALQNAQPILRFVTRNYYLKSQFSDPDPCLTGGLGQR